MYIILNNVLITRAVSLNTEYYRIYIYGCDDIISPSIVFLSTVPRSWSQFPIQSSAVEAIHNIQGGLVDCGPTLNKHK